MTRENHNEIVERIRRLLLTPDGKKKIRQRRSASARMARGLQGLEASGWVLKASRRQVGSDQTVFTVRQGSLQNSEKGLVVFVELCGNGVGTLLPPRSNRGYPILRTTEPDPRELEWAGRDAREYIRACSNMKQPSPERDLQGVILHDLLKSPKHELLRNLWPVRPANCLMEIPTAIQRRGQIGTGNIDLLVRTGRGRWPTFVICELKVDKTTPYDAMVQAIHYAVALDVEVNGIANEIEPADRALYRFLLGSNSTAQDPLRIGAMAIIPNRPGVEKATHEALDTLSANSSWLDVMLFDRGENGEFRPVLRMRDVG